MAEVLFYHLTQSPLEAALPLILEKSLERGWRVQIRSGTPDRLDHLDRHLWTYRDEGFLPHGREGGPHDDAQPILLTTSLGNPNSAEILMLIDGAPEPVEGMGGYERVCILFDGQDPDAVDAARVRWKEVTGAGLAATYWAQEGGRWVKKR